jgi:hypothetical protein
MKKIKFILNCMTSVIKKKIFKSQNTEICQECKNVLKLDVLNIQEYVEVLGLMQLLMQKELIS